MQLLDDVGVAERTFVTMVLLVFVVQVSEKVQQNVHVLADVKVAERTLDWAVMVAAAFVAVQAAQKQVHVLDDARVAEEETFDWTALVVRIQVLYVQKIAD